MATRYEEFVKSLYEQLSRENALRREQELTPEEKFEKLKVEVLSRCPRGYRY